MIQWLDVVRNANPPKGGSRNLGKVSTRKVSTVATGAAGPSGPISNYHLTNASIGGVIGKVLQQAWDMIPSGTDDHYHNQMRKAQGGRPFDLRGLTPEQQRRVQHAAQFASSSHPFMGSIGSAVSDIVSPVVDALAYAGKHPLSAFSDPRERNQQQVAMASMFVPGKGGRDWGENAGGEIRNILNQRAEAARNRLEAPVELQYQGRPVKVSPTALRYANEYNLGGGMGNRLGMNEKLAGGMAKDAEYPLQARDITETHEMLPHLNREGGNIVNKNTVPFMQLFRSSFKKPEDMLYEHGAMNTALDRQVGLIRGIDSARMDQRATKSGAIDKWLSDLGLPSHSFDYSEQTMRELGRGETLARLQGPQYMNTRGPYVRLGQRTDITLGELMKQYPELLQALLRRFGPGYGR